MELSLANLVISVSSSDNNSGGGAGKEPPLDKKASLEFDPRGVSEPKNDDDISAKQDTTTTSSCNNNDPRDASREPSYETVGATILPAVTATNNVPQEGRNPFPASVEYPTETATVTESSNDTDLSLGDGEGLLLTPEELTPIDIDASCLDIEDQIDDDLLAHMIHASFGDQEEDFDHPNEVDDSDIDFLLAGSFQDIEVEKLEQGSLEQVEYRYDNIFGDLDSESDSDSALLASLGQDLIRLTLHQMPDLPPQVNGQGYDWDGEIDELPWDMYCQPCQLENEEHCPPPSQLLTDDFFRVLQGLHSIDEDEPLQDGDLPTRPPHHPSGLDEVPFTLQSIDQLPDTSSALDESLQYCVISQRPEAIRAALSYSQSFGTGIYQPLREGERPNEAQCLGHKETIYGLQFSPCGNYMATASQDATIGVWDVASHRLLRTLTGHSKEAECLRVGW